MNGLPCRASSTFIVPAYFGALAPRHLRWAQPWPRGKDWAAGIAGGGSGRDHPLTEGWWLWVDHAPIAAVSPDAWRHNPAWSADRGNPDSEQLDVSLAAASGGQVEPALAATLPSTRHTDTGLRDPVTEGSGE
jgi:hypothetical protein